MEQSRIDWPSFVTCAAIIAVAGIFLLVSADTARAMLQSLYDYIAIEFGIFYLLASVAAISFLVWLAASRFGNVRLGDSGTKPEFPTLSWVAMLFCAGVGAGLMYWCATEWAFYYESPPFGAELTGALRPGHFIACRPSRSRTPTTSAKRTVCASA
jgi:BCCT family betaine/carnitine transporter